MFWFFSELQTEVINVENVKISMGSCNFAGCVSFISVQTNYYIFFKLVVS